MVTHPQRQSRPDLRLERSPKELQELKSMLSRCERTFQHAEMLNDEQLGAKTHGSGPPANRHASARTRHRIARAAVRAPLADP